MRVSRHAVLTHPHPILCPYTPEGITTGQGVQSVLQAGCGLCVVMRCGRGAGGGFSEGAIYVDKVFRY